MAKKVKFDPVFEEPMVTIPVRKYEQLVRNANVGEQFMRLLESKASLYDSTLTYAEIKLLSLMVNGEEEDV